MIRNTPRKPDPDIVMMDTLARKVVWHLQRAMVLLKPSVAHRLRNVRESALRQLKK